MLKLNTNIETIQNLSLSRNVYSKNILRYKKSNEVGLLDYSFNTSNAIIDTEDNTGNSILYSLKHFKHKNYKELKLHTFLPYEQLSKDNKLAFNFNITTKRLLNDNSNNYLQILNPIKGGFFGYYGGIYGFIPKSHFKRIIAQSISLNKGTLQNKLYFSSLHDCNNLLKPRTLFKAGKISIQPYNIVNNFNDIKVRKTYNNIISFVFISSK
jgi:hypothetical protein